MFVSVTVWFVVVPSAILPKLTLAGFAESVPVPEPPLVPEPPPEPEPPEPEPDVPLAPVLTTPAQLDSPIETTIRTSVASSATMAPITGCLMFTGSDEDNSKWRTSRRVLIIRTV
jgi:hypothetical protein